MSASDKLKLIPSVDESSPDTGHTLPAGLTCGSGKATGMNLLLFLSVASHAKGPALQENGADLPMIERGSSGKSSGSPKQQPRHGVYSRMFQGSLVLMEEQTLTPLFMRYKRAGLLSVGGCWTADFSTSPKEGKECSLSAVLQSAVSQKYFLSPRAAAGILRRAEKRGRELPEFLVQALQALASILTGIT